MHTAPYPANRLPGARNTAYDDRPALLRPVLMARDWLDSIGKGGWIVAMILGFVFAWPVGLFILGYMIWSKRMFGNCNARRRHFHDRRAAFAPTGNSAFDAYRDDTLRRLEEEHNEFKGFLEKLREAKDKAEFDQFMADRKQA